MSNASVVTSMKVVALKNRRNLPHVFGSVSCQEESISV